MDRTNLRFSGAILLSMVVSLILTLIPLPEFVSVWGPDWIALTLVHWAIVLPKNISLFLAWFVGLLVDTLFGTILGQHALGFVIVLYFSMRFSERINPLIVWQQVFLISVVLSVYMLINLWILGVTGNSPNSWNYWLALPGSIIIWPIWHAVLGLLTVTRKHL